jgi:hypothetical protein
MRAAVLALLTFGCGAARADAPPQTPPQRSKPVSDCTRTVGPDDGLAALLPDLPPGATLCLKPGRYVGHLVVSRSLTLVGLGASPEDVVLDGEFQSRLLSVTADEPVTVRNVTLQHGVAQEGGAVLVEGKGPALFEGCVLRRNQVNGAGGGAVYARRGATTLARCRVTENSAPVGGGVLADVIADVTITDSLLAANQAKAGAGIAARDDAHLVIERSTLAANQGPSAIEIVGNDRRTPEVSVHDSILAGNAAAVTGAPAGAKVAVVRSVVEGKLDGVADTTGNRTGAPGFVASGPEPYRPGPKSPAVGLAQAPAGALDLAGHARPAADATAGALEAER